MGKGGDFCISLCLLARKNMIVYEDSKRSFVEDVKTNCIADKIADKIREHGINAGQEREYISWQNSLQFMRNVVDDREIDDDVRIAIEYNIPLTSKRVDFIICGADSNNQDNVVIVELKQWQKADVVADDMHYCVKTFVGGNDRIVCHPSYQAYSYACFIKNYSQTVLDNGINLVPCAYLHNYDPQFKQNLSNPIYSEWINEAPLFIRNEAKTFSDFIKKFVSRKSSNGDLLYIIDHGRLRPSKALQDSLTSMVKGSHEFMLLDEQAVCYDMCLKTMAKCKEDGKKRTIVIQGGPGTGKSVLAINLLMEFINKGLNATYVTKNSAPREAFLHILTKSDAKKLVNIKQLFRSPFGLAQIPNNTYDCLIVDEAHRLVDKMYGDWDGKNQVKECISASLLSIFLLDEDQAITSKDIGSVREIQKWCKDLNSTLKMPEEAKLVSQFRCNGSDAYIQFIDDCLQRTEESVHVDLKELNFDFRVFDSAVELREALREKNAINNKSRMTAGYCYDWDVKKGRGDYDIILPDGFKAKWNLAGDKIFAINPNSFEQVGCIHTVQGLEFDYVGVLIGQDLRYDQSSGRIITDKSMISKDDKTSGIRTSDDVQARRLILNTYKTLLTRGQKGCYVYCEDKALSDYLKRKAGLV